MNGGKPCDSCHLSDPPKLLKENRDAWELFEASCSQLRVSFSGPIGLDYVAMKVVADAMDIKLDEMLMRKIKALELNLVNQMNQDITKKLDE